MMYAYGGSFSFDEVDTEAIKNKALMNAMKGGPNSGFEIEEMSFFKEAYKTNQFPELKEEVEIMISTEAYVNELINFRHRILSRKGMDRGMAHELKELIPTLESYSNVRHFTEELSGIGVEPSLEAISNKLWVIIGAVIGFIIGMIFKFYQWIKGGKKSKPTKQDVLEVKDIAKDQEKAVDTVATAVTESKKETVTVDIPKVIDQQEIQNSHLPETIKDDIIASTKPLGSSTDSNETVTVQFNVFDVLTTFDEGKAVHDYIQRPNKYARLIYGRRTEGLETILEAFEKFPQLCKVVNDRLDQFSILSKHIDETKGGHDYRDASIARRNMTDIHDNTVRDLGLKGRNRNIDTLPDYSYLILDTIENNQDDAPMFKNIEELLNAYQIGQKRLNAVDWTNIVSIFDTLENSQAVLERSKHIADRVLHWNRIDQAPHYDETADMLLKTSKDIQRDISALMKIYSVITLVYHEVSTHGAKITHVVKANAAGIMNFYRRFNQDIPPEIENLVEKIVVAEDTVKKKIIPAHFIQLSDLEATASFSSEAPPVGPVATQHQGVRLEDVVPKK